MNSRIHTKLATAIAVALAIVAVTAAVAAAGGKPSSVIRYSERGSTGYVREATHVSIPANLANFREPGSVGWVPSSGAVATNASAAGLDWESALIGGGVVLGIALLCAGALLAIRRRGTPAHA